MNRLTRPSLLTLDVNRSQTRRRTPLARRWCHLVVAVSLCLVALLPGTVSAAVHTQSRVASSVCSGSTTSQLAGNGGFEAPTSGSAPTGEPPPVTVGNWLADTANAAVAEVGRPNPVFQGRLSAMVQTTAGGSGGYWLQDFPSFVSTSTYRLSAWVFPSAGSQALEFITAWDRGAGNANYDTEITISPSETVFTGFGQAVAVPALTYGRWHHIVVVAMACNLTQQLFLDGSLTVTLLSGTQPVNAPATLLLGETAGQSQDNSTFYYDDVALSSSVPNTPAF